MCLVCVATMFHVMGFSICSRSHSLVFLIFSFFGRRVNFSGKQTSRSHFRFSNVGQMGKVYLLCQQQRTMLLAICCFRYVSDSCLDNLNFMVTLGEYVIAMLEVLTRFVGFQDWQFRICSVKDRGCRCANDMACILASALNTCWFVFVLCISWCSVT